MKRVFLLLIVSALLFTACGAFSDKAETSSNHGEFTETRSKAALPPGVNEEDAIVSAGSGYPLPGKLTLPANLPDGAKLPAVVLVHDIGEWDMDSTMFDNKPFRDIAHYLAQNGIAVLRYDKTTYAHPGELSRLYPNSMTYDLETIYDAIYARQLLWGDSRIDQSRVYVLGHGFGGSLAAEICERGGYSGYISMAGSPRALAEIMYDRYIYQMSRSGEIDDQITTVMDAEIAIYKSFGDMTFEEAAGFTILGIPGSYMKDLYDNPPSGYITDGVPALILQGTNDHEVFFDRDYELFKEFLKNNENAEFRLYEGVNHLFMWSTMESPDVNDYKPVATVEENVLEDIVEWVKAR